MIISPIPSLRVGLKSILDNMTDIEITGEAADLSDPGLLPLSDLVLIAALENPSLVWIAALLQDYPGQRFLFLVNPPPDGTSLRLPPNRLCSFISLDSSPEEVSAAIRALNAGLWVVAPELLDSFFRTRTSNGASQFSPDPSSSTPAGDSQSEIIDPLTPRETEVLQCLAKGMANKEIARHLSISEHTVKYHITSIYSKLGANNRTEAVRQGILNGIIVI